MSECGVTKYSKATLDKNKSKQKTETDPLMQQNHPNTSRTVPLSNYDVTELKMENGQLAMHGLGGVLPTAQAKPTWGSAGDTLESIVHQATYSKRDIHRDQTPANISSMIASSAGTWTDITGQVPLAEGWMRKRTRSDSDYHGNNFSGSTTSNVREERADPSTTCASPSASARARLCRDNETTVTTWASFESPPSLKSTKSTDEDSACHGGLVNKDERPENTKDCESGGSRSTRPRRVAAVHNQSERKRRARINQKMKALQKLVPNASKTDKASMLDEVIKYLEQLQAQVQMMSSMRYMPHMNMNMMNMPLGMHQQQQHLHHMSALAHMGMGGSVNPIGLGMGMGMGMGMLDMSNMARMAAHHHRSLQPPLLHPTPAVAAAPNFIPPFMAVPPLMPPHPTAHPPKPDPAATNNASKALPDPYDALLAQQSMNMDLFNRMAALYSQQVNQTTTVSPSQSNHVRGN